MLELFKHLFFQLTVKLLILSNFGTMEAEISEKPVYFKKPV